MSADPRRRCDDRDVPAAHCTGRVAEGVVVGLEAVEGRKEGGERPRAALTQGVAASESLRRLARPVRASCVAWCSLSSACSRWRVRSSVAFSQRFSSQLISITVDAPLRRSTRPLRRPDSGRCGSISTSWDPRHRAQRARGRSRDPRLEHRKHRGDDLGRQQRQDVGDRTPHDVGRRTVAEDPERLDSRASTRRSRRQSLRRPRFERGAHPQARSAPARQRRSGLESGALAGVESTFQLIDAHAPKLEPDHAAGSAGAWQPRFSDLNLRRSGPPACPDTGKLQGTGSESSSGRRAPAWRTNVHSFRPIVRPIDSIENQVQRPRVGDGMPSSPDRRTSCRRSSYRPRKCSPRKLHLGRPQSVRDPGSSSPSAASTTTTHLC